MKGKTQIKVIFPLTSTSKAVSLMRESNESQLTQKEQLLPYVEPTS